MRRNTNAPAEQGTDRMTKSTTYAVALALIADAIMIAAAGIDHNFRNDPAATPVFGAHGAQTPVRATKGDRLNGRPEFRKIAGVSVVLRDFGRAVR
jgi:hypothetical protein